MSRRVEIEESNEPVPISGRVLNELFKHARETLPEECCGLIIGDDAMRFRWVVACRNEATELHQKDPTSQPRGGREAFVMNPLDYADAEKEAESRAEHVTAVYHSHVGAGAYLSETDLEYAENEFFPFPEADHVVIAVEEHDRQVKGIGVFSREEVGGPWCGSNVVAIAEDDA